MCIFLPCTSFRRMPTRASLRDKKWHARIVRDEGFEYSCSSPGLCFFFSRQAAHVSNAQIGKLSLRITPSPPKFEQTMQVHQAELGVSYILWKRREEAQNGRGSHSPSGRRERERARVCVYSVPYRVRAHLDFSTPVLIKSILEPAHTGHILPFSQHTSLSCPIRSFSCTNPELLACFCYFSFEPPSAGGGEPK